MVETEEINERDHIGLIYHVAQDLATNDEICIRAFGKDVSEYLGEGFLALQIAKKNFNPELGFKFSTYASSVIRDRLLQAARRSSLIKISFQARYQATRAIQGKDIKPEDEDKVTDALRIMRSGILPITDYTEEGNTDDSPTWELSEELYTRLEELDDRTKLVIVMRFGLDGKEPLTLDEVGKKLDPPVTRERVRQIERNGLNKLREVINV